MSGAQRDPINWGGGPGVVLGGGEGPGVVRRTEGDPINWGGVPELWGAHRDPINWVGVMELWGGSSICRAHRGGPHKLGRGPRVVGRTGVDPMNLGGVMELWG